VRPERDLPTYQASTRPKRTSLERRPTQEERILNLLVEAYPRWVELPEILRLGISQYSARIWTLRHERGYDIENEVVILPDKRRGGRFRLTSLAPESK
jgi:hypothetical protein